MRDEELENDQFLKQQSERFRIQVDFPIFEKEFRNFWFSNNANNLFPSYITKLNEIQYLKVQ